MALAMRAFLAFVLTFAVAWYFAAQSPREAPASTEPPARVVRTWSDAELEARVVALLSSRYEQPKNGVWREFKVYFLPEEPQLRELSRTELADGSQLTLYRAAIWFLHWGPERFPVIAWARTREDGVEVGSAQDPEVLAAELTKMLAGLSFDRQEKQEWMARVVGDPVAILRWPSYGTDLEVVTRYGCSEALARLPRGKRGAFLGAACFTPEGRLTEIHVRGVR